MTHPIPDAALDDMLAIVGQRGSGKTYAGKGFVERLLATPARVAIVDPLGVWHGLKSSADGRGAGFPVIIFGGDHADVPIGERSGKALARLIAEHSLQCVIDLSTFESQAARRRFMVDFTTELHARNKAPLHLVLDEADLWAPQRPMPDQTILLNRIDEIARRGRVRGFIPWLITQRPAVMHKDILSQVAILIAMKLTAPQDRNALGAWIEGQADKVAGKAVLADLPKLGVGEGYVWAPGHDILKRTVFPKIKTFDSSRTPKRGEHVTLPAVTARADLSAIAGELADVQAAVDADDPKLLRARIEDLERQLDTRSVDVVLSGEVHSEAIQKARTDGFNEGQQQARAEIVSAAQYPITAVLESLNAAHKGLTGFLSDLVAENAAGLVAPQRQELRVAPPVHQHHAPIDIKMDTPVHMRAEPMRGSVRDRILGALAELDNLGIAKPPRIQAAFLAGYSNARSAGFSNPLGALRTEGLVSFPDTGTVALTPEGKRAAPRVQPIKSSQQLQERVLALLPGVHGKILRAVIGAHPTAMPRDRIAAACGYENARSAGFANPLGRLRSLGLVSYPTTGSVAATDLLFLKGKGR